MKNFDIAWYYDELQALDANLSETKKQKENCIRELQEYFAEEFRNQFKTKNEPYGSVKTAHDGYVIINTTPKKVTWDQRKLADIYKLIQSAGDNPEDYIKVKYDVSETDYKSWPDDVKSVFDDARTVGEGKVKIEIQEQS